MNANGRFPSKAATQKSCSMAKKTTITSDSTSTPNPSSNPVSEADFNDTIAINRGLPLVAAALVPTPPSGFVPTDAATRARRLRRLSDEHRSEARDALVEASRLDLAGLLGKRAPDSARALVLADRMTKSEMLAARAEQLTRYSDEVDEIAMNDALTFLESIRNEYEHEAGHDPSIAMHFPALRRLFDSRSAAISKGIARSAAERATVEDAIVSDAE